MGGGGKKHEIYAAAFGGHLFYDLSVADLRGGARDARAPGPNSFNFMQFLGKFGKIICWRPLGELAPPPWGNPGSATAYDDLMTYLYKAGGHGPLDPLLRYS